jgi:hypothetical protein
MDRDGRVESTLLATRGAMRITVGSNVEARHKQHLKHEGIGLLMLCQNPTCNLVGNPTASQKRLPT